MLTNLLLRTLAFTIVLLPSLLSSQYTQAVRGTVSDVDTQQPLYGATVMVEGSDPVIGASTDMDGRFVIENVPTGRIDLIVRSVGYEEQRLSNLLVTSAKELVLQIRMRTSIAELEVVEIRAKERKDRSSNEMSVISARRINVEESSRTAGGFNDPARMVNAFAGVAGEMSGDNFIVVRGNSSKGVLWRLQGIEIPNPNHFASDGATGGPINVLNSDMIDDSEFYTGAFSAEYGNVLSAVFDMRLRTGNDRKREYTLKAGVLGTDLTAEGPIKGVEGGSYLANFRYSTLSLLDEAGIVDFDGVPRYTDAAVNIKLPSRKFGTWNLFGVGGMSDITQQDMNEAEDTLFSRGVFGSRMGIIGLSNTKTIGEKSFLYSVLSASGNGSDWKNDELRSSEGVTLQPDHRSDIAKWTIRGSTVLNTRLNKKLTMRNGFIFSGEQFNLESSYWDWYFQRMMDEQRQRGSANTYQAYTSWKWRLNEKWTWIAGLHALYYDLNEEIAVEPRTALRFEPDPTKAISLGIGLHSKAEPLTTYLVQSKLPDGSTAQLNTELGLTRAAHAVMGYEQMLSEVSQLKVEVYYQWLYDLPVAKDSSDTFSSSNTDGWFTDRALVNEGEGFNRGIEVSLERYFANGYHFLVTTSLFESKYRPLDDIWYNTRFNQGVVANVLGGREWTMGEEKGKDRTITLGMRWSFMGGQYRTPIDLQASIAAGEEILSERPWSQQGDPIQRVDLVFSYRVGKPRVTHEYKLDIQNVLNAQTPIYFDYNERSRSIETTDQLAILPVFLYTLRF